jgi:nucleoside phosphorylase
VKKELSHYPLPQTILVARGAEYKAVCRGLSRVKPPKPLVMPIPMGSKPLIQYLERSQQTDYLLKGSPPSVLVMGLCGSLSPQLAVGDVVLYEACVYASSETTPRLQSCDSEALLRLRSISESSSVSADCELTGLLQDKLGERVSLVQGLTSDRVICSAPEKRHLGQLYNAQVVDMEGFAALEVLSRAGVAVAMVRVISDDSQHNLPDLNSTISSDGSPQPLPLAMNMIRQPIAAIHLIRGAIYGLRVLQNVTNRLFS